MRLRSLLTIPLVWALAAHTVEPENPADSVPDPLQSEIGPDHERIKVAEQWIAPDGTERIRTNEFVQL